MSTKYFVCGNLNCDGAEYKRGDTVSLEDATARSLLEGGVIQSEPIEEAAPVETTSVAPEPGGPVVGGERTVSGEPFLDIEQEPATERPGILRRIFSPTSTPEQTKPVKSATTTQDVKPLTESENDPSANL